MANSCIQANYRYLKNFLTANHIDNVEHKLMTHDIVPPIIVPFIGIIADAEADSFTYYFPDYLINSGAISFVILLIVIFPIS